MALIFPAASRQNQLVLRFPFLSDLFNFEHFEQDSTCFTEPDYIKCDDPLIRPNAF